MKTKNFKFCHSPQQPPVEGNRFKEIDVQVPESEVESMSLPHIQTHIQLTKKNCKVK